MVVVVVKYYSLLPIADNGCNCGPVLKRQFNSLEFALRGASVKIFHTKSKVVVCQCMVMFNVPNSLSMMPQRNVNASSSTT